MTAAALPSGEAPVRSRWVFIGFALLLALQNLDRILFTNEGFIRIQDMYDWNTRIWPECFSFAKLFDFTQFNDTAVGGFNCQAFGVLPFAPLQLITGAISTPYSSLLLNFLYPLCCFFGVVYFLRAIRLQLSAPLVWLLAFLHFYMTARGYVQVSHDVAALMLYAWLLAGPSLFFSRVEKAGFFALMGVIIVSWYPSIVLPYYPLITLGLMFALRQHLAGGWRAALKRYFVFWSVFALLAVWPTLKQLEIIPGLMRREFFTQIWGPLSIGEIAASAGANFVREFTLLLAAVSGAAIFALTQTKNLVPSYRQPEQRSLFWIVIFVSAIFIWARLIYPWLEFLNKDAYPRSVLAANQWHRIYFALPSLSAVVAIALFGWLQSSLPRPSGLAIVKPLRIVAVVLTALLVFAASTYLLYAGLPDLAGKRAVFLITSFALALISSHLAFTLGWRKQVRALTSVILIVVVAAAVLFERIAYSYRFEQPLPTNSVPQAQAFAASLPERDRTLFRAAAIGFHPSYLTKVGFLNADGYSTLYPMSYKRAWGRALKPSYEKDGSVIPYFRYWGGRAYIFLPGMENGGGFQQVCPKEPIDFATYVDAAEFRKLAVRWIVSRCQLAGDDVREIASNEPKPTFTYRAKEFREAVFGYALEDPIAVYVYELKDYRPIAEALPDGKVMVRANVCRKLNDFGYADSLEEFGFALKPEHLSVAKQCYSSLHDF